MEIIGYPYKEISHNELNATLDKHQLWINSNRLSGERATLNRCDFFGVDFSAYDLRWVDFLNCNLRNSCWGDADLRSVNFSGSDLRDSIFGKADMRFSYLENTDMRSSFLSNCNLECAYFSNTSLTKAKLPKKSYVLLGEKYEIYIFHEGKHVQASSRNCSADDWRNYSKKEILDMGGEEFVIFYPRLLEILDFYLGKGTSPEWVKI